MLEVLPDAGHKTVCADKGYDTAAVVGSSRAACVTPHVQVRCAVDNGTLGSGFGQRFHPANDT
jgi:hypothetical protein